MRVRSPSPAPIKRAVIHCNNDYSPVFFDPNIILIETHLKIEQLLFMLLPDFHVDEERSLLRAETVIELRSNLELFPGGEVD